MDVPAMVHRAPGAGAEVPGHTGGSRIGACGGGIRSTIWAVLAALAMGLFTVGLPAYFDRLQLPCNGGQCLSQQLTPEEASSLRAIGISINLYATYVLGLAIMSAGIHFLVAALIMWRAPAGWMALFAASMLVLFGSVVSEAPRALAMAHPGLSMPLAILGFVGFGSAILFFNLFPGGRFAPRWTRWSVALWILSAGQGIFSPRLVPEALNALGFVLGVGPCVGALIYRYRCVASATQRQQVKWVVYGLGITLSGMAALALLQIAYPIPGLLDLLGVRTVQRLLLSLIPLSIGVAILHHHLWDIDFIINRTLVYGVLTASVVGLYVLLVGWLGFLIEARGNILLSLLATGLVAVLFAPARDRLQRGVNRLMYGERDDPYGVLSRLGKRLEGTLAPDAVLSTIVETVAQALKLPYAAIALEQEDNFTVVATYGQPLAEPLTLSLFYGGEEIGRLLVSPRACGEVFTPSESRLLDELARQAGVTAHAVRLAVDLRSSNENLRTARERLVTAREEERRRLRRDLHDGLGPALASESLKVGAIRKLLGRNAAAADVLLEELGTDIESTIGDIRRLVYDLRPPALDELGLVGAIQERAAQYHRYTAEVDLYIAVDALEPLPSLPAAVEVGAYWIAQEALTNVVRHACARRCKIRITAEASALYLEVTDDGVGLSRERRVGVGLVSMRERADELGGSLVAEALPAGGTRVRARLPLAEEQRND